MSSLKSLSSAKIKQLRKLKQKKYRAQTNSYLCEGYRLFEAAIHASKIDLVEIILGENIQNIKHRQVITEFAHNRNIDLYATDTLQIKKISDEVSPSGILFVVKKETKKLSSLENLNDNTIIYLDRVSEPGNMGTILRTACWFGIKSFILSPECVDPWNPKAVRASAGSIFEADIFTDVSFDHFQNRFKPKGYKFFATVVSDGIPVYDCSFGKKNIIFLGQEADGLSKEILKSADGHINIPGQGSIDSLNLSVAAGIVLYEVTKPDLDK